MSSETARPADPATESFAGDTPARVAKRLFHASRPKFFPASVLPVLAGTAWGSAVAHQFDAAAFFLALIATLCVHAGANVLNDVGDDDSGTDRRNEDRIYPYTGGSRFIQTGIMNVTAMTRWGVGLLILAAIAGGALLILKGPLIIAFGVLGILLAVLYSLGPVRLSGTGFGELAVGIGFGVLPVTGAAWLQSGTIDGYLIMFSLPISAWVAAILLINEVPDIKADAATGKRTLPVRIGLPGTAVLYSLLHLFAAGSVVWLAIAVAGEVPLVTPLVPVLLLLLAFKSARRIRTGIADRAGMTQSIEATLGIHTIGTLWLTAVMLYVAIASAT